MQSILTLETNRYKIKIENFEGPLDLLCHLIDENKMDIYDVNINEITDQYIEYIKEMEQLDLELTSEFLLMASNLLYIKSKKLLPRQESNEEMLSEEELIHRIIEYKKYKDSTSKFKVMYEKNNKKLFRNIKEKIQLPELDLEVNEDYHNLAEIYENILHKITTKMNKNAKNVDKIALIENYVVGDTIKTMYKELIKKSHFVFNRLFSLDKCKPQEVVTAFTGLLEMSRRSKVVTKQERLFGNIEVQKKKREKAT